MPKSSSNSWIDLAFRTATKFGRGVYVAFREGEAEIWKPEQKRPAGEPARWWEVLEVSESASEEEIKAAYRRLMQKTHPDKMAHLSEPEQQEAEMAAKRLNEAYEKAMCQE
jgi:DnaJ-domain-containing protein 1